MSAQPYSPDELSEVVEALRPHVESAEASRTRFEASDSASDDMRYLAKAMNALPRLLATLAAQQAELERWRKAVEEAENDAPQETDIDDEEDAEVLCILAGKNDAYRNGWLDAIHYIYRVNQEQGKGTK